MPGSATSLTTIRWFDSIAGCRPAVAACRATTATTARPYRRTGWREDVDMERDLGGGGPLDSTAYLRVAAGSGRPSTPSKASPTVAPSVGLASAGVAASAFRPRVNGAP